MEEGGEGGDDGEEEADAETGERLGRGGTARPNRSRLLSASDLDREIAAAGARQLEERLAGIAAAATGRGRRSCMAVELRYRKKKKRNCLLA